MLPPSLAEVLTCSLPPRVLRPILTCWERTWTDWRRRTRKAKPRKPKPPNEHQTLTHNTTGPRPACTTYRGGSNHHPNTPLPLSELVVEAHPSLPDCCDIMPVWAVLSSSPGCSLPSVGVTEGSRRRFYWEDRAVAPPAGWCPLVRKRVTAGCMSVKRHKEASQTLIAFFCFNIIVIFFLCFSCF